jgi:nucleotide-binding universal stress UspA family protein
VEVGDPAGVIVDIARARGADLIMLGRRGLGTLARLLLGSVSHKVIQVADRPCLTVP